MEEIIEILLSNFQSFTPKTDINLIKLFRNTNIKKLPRIGSIINGLKEFANFVTVGRIKLEFEENEFCYYDISFRIPPNTFSQKSKVIEFILNDVTQIIQIENDKNDINFKSMLLAKIAHEFKNPINTINAVCSNLNSKIMQNPEIMAELKAIQGVSDNSLNNFNFISSLCEYLLFLIEDLNTFIKRGLNKNKNTKNSVLSETQYETESEKSFKAEMTVLNLTKLLDFCYNIFYIRQAYDKSKPMLKILKDYCKSLPTYFYTNETKLKQVLINLISNAYKFTVSGYVTLMAKFMEYEDKNTILFSIIDTGSGIEANELPNLFTPFKKINKNQRFNCQGSGLGLSIVKDILHNFDSKIQVKSESGKGSTFSFELEDKNKANISRSRIIKEDNEFNFESNKIDEDNKSNYF